MYCLHSAGASSVQSVVAVPATNAWTVQARIPCVQSEYFVPSCNEASRQSRTVDRAH